MKRVLMSVLICGVILGLLMSGISCSEKTPEIRINNVDTPFQVEVGKNTTATVTIENDENESVTVVLTGNSSRIGQFISESILLPSNDTVHMTYKLDSSTLGTQYLTFGVSYKGNELDSWQRIVEIIPTPTPTPTPAPTPKPTPTPYVFLEKFVTTSVESDMIRITNNSESTINIFRESVYGIYCFNSYNVPSGYSVPGGGCDQMTLANYLPSPQVIDPGNTKLFAFDSAWYRIYSVTFYYSVRGVGPFSVTYP